MVKNLSLENQRGGEVARLGLLSRTTWEDDQRLVVSVLRSRGLNDALKTQGREFSRSEVMGKERKEGAKVLCSTQKG